MKPKNILLISFLVLLAATISGDQKKTTVKDDLGFSFLKTSPPQRIISLAPNITEILFAMSSGDKVVGVTRFCDYPEEVLKKEKIGGMVDPSLEKIKALNPDLILGFRGNPLRVLKRLRSLHLPVFVLEMGTNLESVFILIEKIGTIIQKEKNAQILIQSLKKKYEKIQFALQSVEHEPKVFFSLHGMGLWTCGKESFLNDLVRKARGVNIAGDVPRRWLDYNREQLIHKDPEVIIILAKSLENFSKVKKSFKNDALFKGIKAVTTDSLYFLDENLATRPGPRIFDALAKLARLLHPQCFETGLKK
ncbi:MAG: helical backbone metal receptor [Candidatus Aminicenantaceae bacterium]